MTLTRRPTALLLAVAIAAVLVAFATNVLPVSQIVDQRARVAASRAELTRLETENAVLSARAEALGSPVEVERIARDRLGYVRPGEEAYVIVDPTGPAPEQPSVAETAEPSLLARIWAFFTGSDLSG